MKVKDINIGESYRLATLRNSLSGCSTEYFKKFLKSKVTALKKLNNYNSKNNVFVQCYDEKEGLLVDFWCSSYDLERVKNES